MPGYGEQDMPVPATALVTVHVSRKQRGCANCDGYINPGQRYQRIAFPPSVDYEHWAVYAAHASAGDCWFTGQMIRHELPGQVVLNPEFLPGGAG